MRRLHGVLEFRDALLRSLGDAYLEVFPARDIEEQLAQVPPGSYVAVTCSPRRGIDATLALCEGLRRYHLRVVPHLSARQFVDRVHLRDVLARLQALRVDSVFVPGGDVAEPCGEFTSSLELLRAMAEIGHGCDDVGIAAHPEGHPSLDAPTLLAALREKQALATYLVTQMCFDSAALLRWLRGIRAQGIHLPAWIGLPGVVPRRRLLSIALRIGVGDSLGFLRGRWNLLGALLGRAEYRPDALLEGLAPFLDDPDLAIAGFHLFSFNEVHPTERWRSELLERLKR